MMQMMATGKKILALHALAITYFVLLFFIEFARKSFLLPQDSPWEANPYSNPLLKLAIAMLLASFTFIALARPGWKPWALHAPLLFFSWAALSQGLFVGGIFIGKNFGPDLSQFPLAGVRAFLMAFPVLCSATGSYVAFRILRKVEASSAKRSAAAKA